MHCLKRLKAANSGTLQLMKNAVLSSRAGADMMSRSQQPVPLSAWAASAHTHRAFHHLNTSAEDQGHSKSHLMSSMEDLLFYTITDGKETIPLSQFTSALRRTGLLTSDPRLRDCIRQMRQSTQDSIGPVMMDKKLFRRCVGNNIMLLTKAFRKKFIIPDFDQFTQQINKMYESAHQQEGGCVADYIPQLAKFSPELWGVSLCTIDGQRHSVGDTKVPFCLQSCVKPLEYAIAVHELGSEHVHRFVGKEPSGFKFNKLSLNEDDKPHNPMVNAGAIVISSLIKELHDSVRIFYPAVKFKQSHEQFPGHTGHMSTWSDTLRYNVDTSHHDTPPTQDCTQSTQTLPSVGTHTLHTGFPAELSLNKTLQIMEFLKSTAGAEYVGFSNATFQSEKETGDRNYAIGYYLKEKKCFPDNADMTAALDFYFQLCSIEMNCESGSVMAATLANGGICPITGDRVLSAEAVCNTLSLMHSCGMYDFSGQFAFYVGLPAKSGVSGAVLLVVPNVMGMMCWSPPLDRLGNSVRGIHFCQELVSYFNFHNYDNLRHFTKKHDPRRRSDDDPNKSVVNLMFAAYSGDVSALRRFALSAVDMDQRDYDSRTALHIAAAEGHEDVVRFLTEICKVNPHVKDRWGNTPLDDAMQFSHNAVVSVLQKYQGVFNDRQSAGSERTDEQKTALDSLKGTL